MRNSLPNMLRESIGLHPAYFELLARRAPDTYKHYTIKKRTGGDRWIAQPAKETKHIQRWLIDNIFFRLPIHKCATAYKAETSITINAGLHSGNSYLAKFDFSNFFNSIKYHNIANFLTGTIGNDFSPDDILDIARISCVRELSAGLCLSVGAPSSPLLSNAIMYDFDLQVEIWCKERNITYTRYADDLSFSTNLKGVCSEIEPYLINILKESDSPSLRLNEAKTIHTSKKFQRRVTGLILNSVGQVSLGRDRKREISALIHRFGLGLLSDLDAYRLQGLLGFAADAEPTFVASMSRKYGSDALSRLYLLRKPKDGTAGG